MPLSWGQSGDYYVSALDGDDGDGGGANDPFATIGAAVAAAESWDTIVIGSGTYVENISIPTTKNLSLVGDGRVILDGTITDTGTTSSHTLSVTGIRFVTSGTAIDLAGVYKDHLTATRCEFIGCSYVLNEPRHWSAAFTNCLFRDIATKVVYGFQNSITLSFSRCTFINCAYGIDFRPGTKSALSIANCIFDGTAGRHINVPTAGMGTALDWTSIYPFDADQDVRWNGTSYDSLAALQAAGVNTNGYAQDVSYADEAIDDYHLAPTEALKTGGSGGSYIGAFMPAVMFSPNVNDVLVWSNPYSTSNLEQDGNDFWVLTNPGSGQYVSQVVDLAGDENLRRVMPVIDALANATSLDTTTGDYWWSMEWRYQTDAQGSFQPDAGSPAWTEFVWDRDMDINARYVQWRVTPRTNGP